MWKVAQVEEGSTVAVFGLGAVGLAVIYYIIRILAIVYVVSPCFMHIAIFQRILGMAVLHEICIKLYPFLTEM